MESNNNKNIETIKFLCSYGEKILPRYTDDTLHYAGDLTCVLTVDRSISFTIDGEARRCQLPTGNLETLISITSDNRLRRNGWQSYLRCHPAVDSQSSLLRPFFRL
ncbi:hypothetical protein CFP56_008394 [Quercus suber]|uniref:Uncharacterized protein n=1 Tax=Quercus suber TaxID=58331 RepID=A0AAW0I5H8_QUESU